MTEKEKKMTEKEKNISYDQKLAVLTEIIQGYGVAKRVHEENNQKSLIIDYHMKVLRAIYADIDRMIDGR